MGSHLLPKGVTIETPTPCMEFTFLPKDITTETPTSCMEFTFLPNDMVVQILSNLSLTELDKFALVNSYYRKLIKATRWPCLIDASYRYLVYGYQMMMDQLELRYEIVDSNTIQVLRKLSKLRFYKCAFKSLREEDIIMLSNVKSIEFVYCVHFPLYYCGKLHIDYFCSDNIESHQLKYLSQCAKVDLHGRNYRYIDQDLVYLSSVKELNLSNFGINDSNVRYLSGIEKLIICQSYNLTNGGLTSLHNVKELYLYYCSNIDPSGNNLNRLEKTHVISYPNVSNYPYINSVGSSDFGPLNTNDTANTSHESLSSLRELHLFCNGITDLQLQYLTRIKKVILDNVKVTDDSLSHLSHVNFLRLRKCSEITNEGFWFIRNVPELQIEDMAQITDAGLRYLDNVNSLSIKNCNLITNRGINLLKVAHLSISNNSNITNSGAASLTNLSSLRIENCGKITDRIVEISNAKELTLMIDHNSLTNERAQYLKNQFDGIYIEMTQYHVTYHLIRE